MGYSTFIYIQDCTVSASEYLHFTLLSLSQVKNWTAQTMAADCIPSCLPFYHKEIWNSSRKNCPSVRRGVEKMMSAYIYISNVADDAWESRSQYGHRRAMKRTMIITARVLKVYSFDIHGCFSFIYSRAESRILPFGKIYI